MIEMVTRAEERLAAPAQAVFVAAQLPKAIAPPVREVAPILRGACSRKDARSRARGGASCSTSAPVPAILNFVNGKEVARYSQAGVVTPDHVIRTKNWPLVVPAPEDGKLDDFKRAARRRRRDAFVARYHAYFARHNARIGGSKTALDPLPRVVLVPGLGLFGVGRIEEGRRDRRRSRRDRGRGHHRCRGDRPLRVDRRSRHVRHGILVARAGQARRAAEKPLGGQVAVVTGGGGAIGARPPRPSPRRGAEVALLDVDERGAQAGKAIGTALAACDVTDADSVRAAFDKVAGDLRRRRHRGLERRRGLAGPHRRGRRSGAARELRAQLLRPPARGAGGGAHHAGAGHRRLPAVQRLQAGGQSGPDFGPYGLPKAATLFLVRQYALDYGADGIRANAVNADRIRSGLLTDDMIAERSQGARRERARLHGRQPARPRGDRRGRGAGVPAGQALALKTTGDVTTVDGGNIAAALR